LAMAHQDQFGSRTGGVLGKSVSSLCSVGSHHDESYLRWNCISRPHVACSQVPGAHGADLGPIGAEAEAAVAYDAHRSLAAQCRTSLRSSSLAARLTGGWRVLPVNSHPSAVSTRRVSSSWRRASLR